jgi:hypothetical protein
MPIGRIIFAVIVAGVGGTLANSVVVAALTPNELVPLAISPGRNAVAVLVAALLPLIYMRLAGATAAILGIVALTVIPTVLAKTVFAIGAPWLFGFGVNAVYAIAAWAVYLAIAGSAATARRSRFR